MRGEKKEKQGSKGHLEVSEVNGRQSILPIIGSIVLLYSGCANELNLRKALKRCEVKHT